MLDGEQSSQGLICGDSFDHININEQSRVSFILIRKLISLIFFSFEKEFLVRLSQANFCSSNVASGDLIAEMILLYLSCEGKKIRQTNVE